MPRKLLGGLGQPVGKSLPCLFEMPRQPAPFLSLVDEIVCVRGQRIRCPHSRAIFNVPNLTRGSGYLVERYLPLPFTSRQQWLRRFNTLEDIHALHDS